jgi:hypothetical protein
VNGKSVAKELRELVRFFRAHYAEDPRFDAISVFSESAIATYAGVEDDFDYPRLIENVTRALGEAAAGPGRMLVVAAANYSYSPELTRQHVQWMEDYGLAAGGPDILPPDADGIGFTWSQAVIQGLGGDWGTKDFRGLIPITTRMEAPDFDGSLGTGDFDEMIPRALDQLRANLVFCTYFGDEGWKGNAGSSWARVQHQAATRLGVTNPACPAVFAGRCSTG